MKGTSEGRARLLCIPLWLLWVGCGSLHLTVAFSPTESPISKHKVCVMLKLFPKIPSLLEQIHLFKASIAAELTTNFTTSQFIFGMFSRAFYKRCQEKTLQSLYWERLCFTWAASLLLSHGYNGKFPSSLWPPGSSEPDRWLIPYTCGPSFMHVFT